MIAVDGAHILMDGTFRTGTMLTEKGDISAVCIAQQRWRSGGMIAAMDEAGLLDDPLSLAHAIHTSPAERERLARRGVAVAHNPLSNLTLGSGVLPLVAYLEAGVTVGIGPMRRIAEDVTICSR